MRTPSISLASALCNAALVIRKLPSEQPLLSRSLFQTFLLVEETLHQLLLFVAVGQIDQVGAAVRSLHEQSRKSLQQYFKLSPVIDGVEGAYTKIDDLASVKLIGNVPADGKASGGVLRHRGWKADAVNLPNVPARTNLSILAPAELEVE